MNFTIHLPEGTTNHGDPRLICTPATWKDIVLFYITNYFIHAATLPTSPGESKREIVFAVINALFIPGFGALRVVRRLVMYPSLRRGLSPVQQACAAGALCMVVSQTTIMAMDRTKSKGTDQNPESSYMIQEALWATETFHGTLGTTEIPPDRNIHGICELPPGSGYELMMVPFGVQLREGNRSSDVSTGSNPGAKFGLGVDYSFAKALFSLVQIIAGSITIYRARGDQITQYGYGSFGNWGRQTDSHGAWSLSVVPYVFMSSVNAIASVLSPTYPAMYLVRTPDMDLAESEGGRFEGIVAELIPHTELKERGDRNATETLEKVPSTFLDKGRRGMAGIGIFLLSLAIPLALVGGLSRFNPGLISSTAQRGWIISWVTVGSVSSLGALFFQYTLRDFNVSWSDIIVFVCFLCPFWIPAIGGMVTVGGQLREYGICTRFDG